MLGVANAATTECPSTGGWTKLHKSCYTYVATAATRAAAWTDCISRDSEARLAAPNDGAELTIIGQYIDAETALSTPHTHWLAGYRSTMGFQANGTSNPALFTSSFVHFDAYYAAHAQLPWKSLTFGEGAFAWLGLVKNTLSQYEWELFKDDTYTYSSVNDPSWTPGDDTNANRFPYVCELKLTECQPHTYSASSAVATLWDDAAAGQTEEKDCPSGFTGKMYRECNLSPVYTNHVDFSACQPVIGNTEYTETNFQNCDSTCKWESLGWTHDHNGAVAQALPADVPVSANTLEFGNGFGGSIMKTYNLPDQSSRRQLLTASELALQINYPYVKFTFDLTASNFDVSATATFALSVNSVEVTSLDVKSVQNGATASYEFVISRSVHDIEAEMNVTIASEVSGISSDSIQLKDFKFKTMTKQDLATHCMDTDGFRYATRHPELQHADSGFIDASGVDLVTKFHVPRQLYFLNIEWTGGTNVTYTNYYDTWNHPNTTTANKMNILPEQSHWGSDFASIDGSNCGEEVFQSAIPWESFENVWTATEEYSEEDITPVTDDNGTSYLLTAELTLNAREFLLAYSNNTQRTMPTYRESTWRYPLGIKFKRTITINSTFTAKACIGSQNICTVRHVAALVTYVQTETFPVTGTTTGTYAEIVVGIKTLVAYPYMFISGDQSDDPGTGNSAHADSSQSAMGAVFGTRNDGGFENFTSWTPPHVAFSASRAGVEIQKTSGNYIEMIYTHENPGSCDHDVNQPVENQLTKECEQNWYMKIVPINHSCYIDGTYTIYFYARCFKSKPVCVFVKSGNSWQNGVTSELTLKSPNMCPQMIEQIDLSGALCPIGRFNGDDVTYEDSCKNDPSFVQGEKVQFRLDLTSQKAKISTVTLKEIYVYQDYSVWETAQNQADGLIPRHDDQYNANHNSQGKVLIWRQSPALTLTFDDGALPAITTADLDVVTDISNSDDAIPNTASATLSNDQAAFEILFNQYIFPTSFDGQSDLYFTVVATVVYEGFHAAPEVGIHGTANKWGAVDENGVSAGTDQEFCAGTIVSQYASNSTAFCAYHPEAKLCCESCPTNADCVSAGRRSLKEERRNLQQTMINGGSEEFEATTKVSIRRLQAEINGHVDKNDDIIRFELRMNVNDQLRDLLRNPNTIGTFHDRIEYHLATNGDARGQIQVMQVGQTDPNSNECTVVVDIKKIVEYTNSGKSPYEVAKRLEVAIGSGSLSKDSFFKHIEILGLKYHAVPHNPEKVDVGTIKQFDNDSSASAFGLLVFAFAFFLW